WPSRIESSNHCRGRHLASTHPFAKQCSKRSESIVIHQWHVACHSLPFSFISEVGPYPTRIVCNSPVKQCLIWTTWIMECLVFEFPAEKCVKANGFVIKPVRRGSEVTETHVDHFLRTLRRCNDLQERDSNCEDD